jgi:hypothetical protein
MAKDGWTENGWDELAKMAREMEECSVLSWQQTVHFQRRLREPWHSLTILLCRRQGSGHVRRTIFACPTVDRSKGQELGATARRSVGDEPTDTYRLLIVHHMLRKNGWASSSLHQTTTHVEIKNWAGPADYWLSLMDAGDLLGGQSVGGEVEGPLKDAGFHRGPREEKKPRRPVQGTVSERSAKRQAAKSQTSCWHAAAMCHHATTVVACAACSGEEMMHGDSSGLWVRTADLRYFTFT